jgi:hypothetical protein
MTAKALIAAKARAAVRQANKAARARMIAKARAVASRLDNPREAGMVRFPPITA